jgi:hypothetical protein
MLNKVRNRIPFVENGAHRTFQLCPMRPVAMTGARARQPLKTKSEIADRFGDYLS